MAILRQLAPLVLRLRPGGRSQKAVEALVSLLEELGESEEAEDWWQRLVEFRPGSAAEGELSTVPGSEASEDLPSSSENQAVSRRLLCWRKKNEDIVEHEKHAFPFNLGRTACSSQQNIEYRSAE